MDRVRNGIINRVLLSPLVLLSGISKSFDGKEVISQLDLTINNGEFLTLLGPFRLWGKQPALSPGLPA